MGLIRSSTHQIIALYSASILLGLRGYLASLVAKAWALVLSADLLLAFSGGSDRGVAGMPEVAGLYSFLLVKLFRTYMAEL